MTTHCLGMQTLWNQKYGVIWFTAHDKKDPKRIQKQPVTIGRKVGCD